MMKVTHEISDFRREIDDNCALMGFTQRVVVIPSRRFGKTYRFSLQGLSIKEASSLHFGPLKMRSKGRPETLVRNYNYTPRRVQFSSAGNVAQLYCDRV